LTDNVTDRYYLKQCHRRCMGGNYIRRLIMQCVL